MSGYERRPEGVTTGGIQWKGTDVCLDFRCKCGWGGHLDAGFAYVIHCGACGLLWEAPHYITYRPSERDPEDGCVIEPDDEGWVTVYPAPEVDAS